MAATAQSRPAGSARRPPIAETAVAGHRRGGGWRRGILRSVRTQLLAPIVVATVGLLVLGTIQTVTSAAAAADARRTQILARTAIGTVRLVHEVDRELAESIALRQRGGKAGAAIVTGQRGRTNAMADRYREASRQARESVPGLAEPLKVADAVLNELETARVAVLTSSTAASAEKVFSDLTEALLEVADALPAHIADAGLANEARAVAMIAAVEHDLSLERSHLRAIFARGALAAGELVSVATLVGQREEHLEEFNRAADRSARDRYRALVQGIDVAQTGVLRQGVLGADRDPGGLKVDPDLWYIASSNTIRRTNLVGIELSDRLDASAEEIANSAWLRALGTAAGTFGVITIALTTAVILAVRTSRRLRQLRAAALTVARRELPEAILAVASGAAPDSVPGGAAAGGPGEREEPSAAAVTRSLATANDEIGEVADAFATVHRSALRLAGQQAEMRVDVARMAEILARRIRTLITRQLRLLDEFEREETDPEVLARLFALDHLAARMRRNGENLLVLAGGEPGRAYHQAFPLGAVVTAAASEIEEFARVEAAPGDIMIVGPVVGDLVHLLAELLENATSFSPPDKPVKVDGRRTIDGAVIRIHDNGIGIVGSKIDEINKRLAQPATLTSAAAGTMGLHVVAHLAARHGIRVQLHPTASGTVAYVALPHPVISVQPAIAPAPRGVALELGAPGRPALIATRSTPPAELAPAPNHPVIPLVAVASPATAPLGETGPPAAQRPAPAQRSAAGADSWPSVARTVSPPTDWFRPYAGDGAHGGGAPLAGVSVSMTTSRTAQMPAIRVDSRDALSRPGFAPHDGAGQPADRRLGGAGEPDQSGSRTGGRALGGAGGDHASDQVSATSDGLPKRNPGALLAPEVAAPPAKPAAAASVDPEAVRARLSAFAEGVSAALRGNPNQR